MNAREWKKVNEGVMPEDVMSVYGCTMNGKDINYTGYVLIFDRDEQNRPRVGISMRAQIYGRWCWYNPSDTRINPTHWAEGELPE